VPALGEQPIGYLYALRPPKVPSNMKALESGTLTRCTSKAGLEGGGSLGTNGRMWKCWRANGVVITRLDYLSFSYLSMIRIHAPEARNTLPLIDFCIPCRVLSSGRKSLGQIDLPPTLIGGGCLHSEDRMTERTEPTSIRT